VPHVIHLDSITRITRLPCHCACSYSLLIWYPLTFSYYPHSALTNVWVVSRKSPPPHSGQSFGFHRMWSVSNFVPSICAERVVLLSVSDENSPDSSSYNWSTIPPCWWLACLWCGYTDHKSSTTSETCGCSRQKPSGRNSCVKVSGIL
jgi:hypothetical protein